MIFVILLRYLPIYILLSVGGYFIVKRIKKRLIMYYIAGVIFAPMIDMIIGIICYFVLSIFWTGTRILHTAITDSFYVENIKMTALHEDDNYYIYISKSIDDKGFASIEYKIDIILQDNEYTPSKNKYCLINYNDMLYSDANRNKLIYCKEIIEPTSRYMVKTSAWTIGTLGLGEKIVVDRKTNTLLGRRRWVTNPISFPFFASLLLPQRNIGGKELVYSGNEVQLEYLVLKSK